ncbi:MAG: MG2 domain-containing protein [Saprospiraceae bacterium]
MKYLPIFAIFGAALFILFSFNSPLSMLEFSNDPYSEEWKKIEELESKGLPKSALEEVVKLYERAQRENNAPQIVKALIYRGKYTTQLEEDGLVKAIQLLQTEEAKLKFPEKQVLQSVLASVYQRYLNNNLYRIRQRTETANFDNTDIRTWTAEQLYQESARLFLASIEDKKLQRVAVEDFTAITTAGKNVTDLRPTLYDFLAHQAIDFFTNDRSFLTKPAYAFQIDEKHGFADAKAFANRDFAQQDTESDKYRTVVLLQDLLRFHLKDKSATALVDADLKRLKFIYNNANRGTRDSLYLDALIRLEKQHQDAPIITDVMYQRAQLAYQKGQNYQPNPDNVNRYAKREAYEICAQAIQMFPESLGAQNCRALMAQIQQKKLEIRTEQVNLPEQPILGRLEYRNIEQVYFKVAAYTEADQKAFEQLNSIQQVKYLNGLVPLQTWNLELPNDNNFNQVSTEFPVEGLPLGRYVVIAADNADFSSDKGAVSFLFNHVSKIGYWHRKDEGQQTEFTVVDRETGAPLEGVIATFFATEYNRRKNLHEYKQIGNAVSDERGLIFPRVKKNYFEVRFQNGDDNLYIGDRYSSYSYNNRPQKNQRTHFFLDRAIYRPGQTVYFKGLLVEMDEQSMPTILPNQNVTVTLFDANYQKVKDLELRSNEYGTVNGSFIAPTTGMLGQMSLSASVGNSRQFFRVEEYKRPKFEVDFQPLTDSYTIDKKVSVTGEAKSFAGANVDGAKVQYRVVRETVFPYRPWWFYRGYNPYQRDEMEIANGTVETDANGSFNIEFTAIGDATIPAKEKPQFNYRVTADVTDITGETQSKTTYVRVGTVALQVDVNVAKKVNRDTLRSFKIDAKSLNGEAIPAEGTVMVHALQSPKRTFIKRYWSRPDTHLLTRAQFYKQFPTYPYEDENLLENWRKEKQIFRTKFNTATNKNIQLGNVKKDWDAGNYVLTLKTKDADGNTIEVKK